MLFELILGIIGGLGLFIYGMHLMTDSLKKLTLSKLKLFLSKATNNRFKGLFVGTFITSLIQSSSATSVIVIGFVNAGLMSFVRAIPILIGANIGTTITAQLIAFKLTTFAPIFIGIGALTYFISKKDKHKKVGLIILGFGLLFFGLKMMSGAVEPLSNNVIFKNLFVAFGQNPILGILIGLIVTVILQSSSTTIAIVIALATVGLIDLRAAIFLILGDNIGTCITAVIASFNGNNSGKKVALFHVLFNVIGTLVALILLPLYFYFIPLTSSDIARQIANTHTFFNIFNAIIFLPFIALFVKLINKIIPGKDYANKKIQYLKRQFLETPSLAIDALIKEMLVMLSLTKKMLKKCNSSFKKFNHNFFKEVLIDEDSVDAMQKKMTSYVVAISRRELTNYESNLIPKLLHSINDIEKLGDYGQKLMNVSQKMYEDNLKFSKDARQELASLFDLLFKQIDLTSKAIENNDKKLAKESILIKKNIYLDIKYSKNKHIIRLKNNVCYCDAGIQFTNVVGYIKKASSHLNNIAEMVLSK